MISVPQINFANGVNAPQGAPYSPPRYDFNLLSGLVGDYYQGAGLANELAQRNAFPNGLPRDAQGNVDVQAIQDKSVKLGGVQAAQGYVPLLMGQQAGQYAANLLGAPVPQRGAAPAAPNADTNLFGQPPAPAGAPPKPPAQQFNYPAHGIPTQAGGPDRRNGPENSQPDHQTVYAAVTAALPDRNAQERMFSALQVRGVNREDDLNDRTRPVVDKFLQARKGSVVPDGYSAGQGPVSQAQPQQPQQPPMGGSPQAGAQFPRPAVAPPMAGPTSPVPQAIAQPVGGFPASPAVAQQQQQAAQARAEASRLYQGAAILSGTNPKQAEILQTRAKALDEKAKEFEASYNRSIEKQADLSATTSNKLYAGLNSQATTAAGMMPQLEVAKSILYDPQMYTGTAEHQVLGIRRAVASIAQQFPGLQFDPRVGGGSVEDDMRRGSAPQEILRKVIATNILHQVADLRAETSEMGASGSRIFQQQIELMIAAAQNGDNSIEANRFLTELSYRTARRQMEIGDMAARYVDERGQLNPRFDVEMRRYMLDHPIFTREELADRRLITAPEAPQTVRSEADAAKWGNYMGLRPGDPFRVDGKIKYWHGGAPPR